MKIVLLAAALVGAGPAVAPAATIHVDPAASSGCCRTIAQGLAAAKDGDVVELAAGRYGESGLTIAAAVRLAAAPGADVTIAPSGGGAQPVLTLAAGGARAQGIAIEVPNGGGPAVAVSAGGTALDAMRLTRKSAGVVGPLVLVASTGPFDLRSSVLVDAPDRGDATPPAVLALPGSEPSITDSRIVAGVFVSAAVELQGTAFASHIDRSVLLAQSAGADALRILSGAADHTAKAVELDSTVLLGGPQGAGLHVLTQASGSGPSVAGDVGVGLNHVTTTGAARSVQLQAQANGAGGPAGSIAVTARSSILHGDAAVQSYFDLLFGASNAARLTITGSDTPSRSVARGGAVIDVRDSTSTSDAALFLPSSAEDSLGGARLRQDAPVRRLAPAPQAGESARDVDGDLRVGASDRGADEFTNRPPVSRLAKRSASVRLNQPMTFDAGASTDPDAIGGGKVAGYRWDFGDGVSATTTTPVVTHAYTKAATFRARVTAIDDLGLAGAPSAPVEIPVRDTKGPVVTIVSPRPDARIARMTRVSTGGGRTRSQRARVRFAGTVRGDASAVAGVRMTLQLTRSARARASAKTCRYLDPGKRAIVGKPCSKPVAFALDFTKGVWVYRTTRKTVLPAGRYKIIVSAVDKAGARGVSTRMITLR